jgi:putative FmdB family regulatory protein
MPIYEYRCADCERSVEVLVRPGHREDAECPACHGAHLTREMSVFAARGGDTNGVAAAAHALTSNGSGGRPSGGGCCGGACGCH